MTPLIVIPARAGSKGLPGKNTAMVGDASLVQRASRFGAASGHGCVVTTDDPEAALHAAETVGVVVVSRPSELASDTAGLVDVVLHAVDAIGSSADVVVLLQPTTPFRPEGLIELAIDLVRLGSPAAVGMKVIDRDETMLFRADDRGLAAPLSVKPAAVRRQDVERLLTPNGSIYAIRVDILRQYRTFVPTGTMPIVQGPLWSIDIDSAEDLELARAVAAYKNL